MYIRREYTRYTFLHIQEFARTAANSSNIPRRVTTEFANTSTTTTNSPIEFYSAVMEHEGGSGEVQGGVGEDTSTPAAPTQAPTPVGSEHRHGGHGTPQGRAEEGEGNRRGVVDSSPRHSAPRTPLNRRSSVSPKSVAKATATFAVFVRQGKMNREDAELALAMLRGEVDPPDDEQEELSSRTGSSEAGAVIEPPAVSWPSHTPQATKAYDAGEPEAQRDDTIDAAVAQLHQPTPGEDHQTARRRIAAQRRFPTGSKPTTDGNVQGAKGKPKLPALNLGRAGEVYIPPPLRRHASNAPTDHDHLELRAHSAPATVLSQPMSMQHAEREGTQGVFEQGGLEYVAEDGDDADNATMSERFAVGGFVAPVEDDGVGGTYQTPSPPSRTARSPFGIIERPPMVSMDAPEANSHGRDPTPFMALAQGSVKQESISGFVSLQAAVPRRFNAAMGPMTAEELMRDHDWDRRLTLQKTYRNDMWLKKVPTVRDQGIGVDIYGNVFDNILSFEERRLAEQKGAKRDPHRMMKELDEFQRRVQMREEKEKEFFRRQEEAEAAAKRSEEIAAAAKHQEQQREATRRAQDEKRRREEEHARKQEEQARQEWKSRVAIQHWRDDEIRHGIQPTLQDQNIRFDHRGRAYEAEEAEDDPKDQESSRRTDRDSDSRHGRFTSQRPLSVHGDGDHGDLRARARSVYTPGGTGRKSLARELAGQGTPAAEYMDRKHDEIRKLILSEFSRPLMGTTPPSQYTGDGKTSQYMRWLMEFVRYLASNWMTGDDSDPIRVAELERAIGGKALDWYTDHVLRDRMEGEDLWSFEDIVIALYDQFVHPRLADEQEADYSAVEFSEEKGIEDFYLELKSKARNLIEPPRRIDMCRRFFDGLPLYMRRHLTRLRLDPDHNDIRTILDAGYEWERSEKVMKNSMARAAAAKSVPRTASAGSGRHAPVERTEGRVFKSQYHTERRGRESNELVRQRSFFKQEDEKYSRNKPDARGDEPKREYRAKPQYGAPKDAKPSTPVPDLKCYTCGKPGHKSWECPTKDSRAKPPQVKFRAVRDQDVKGPGDDREADVGEYEPEMRLGEDQDDQRSEDEPENAWYPDYDEAVEYYEADRDYEEDRGPEQLGAISDYQNNHDFEEFRAAVDQDNSGYSKEYITRPVRSAREKKSLVAETIITCIMGMQACHLRVRFRAARCCIGPLFFSDLPIQQHHLQARLCTAVSLRTCSLGYIPAGQPIQGQFRFWERHLVPEAP
ncbi:hypothetical protein D9611_015019 [Ephemerocybe angulata]|uniref:CCHC-type domain-containing protein n=1 Tax=Ephemerocybe angulata TaxID=980116 RepID=A0A8H5C2R8_9AGAR|nr:hypothetical protein D9611_015019 [Tulosesus angulatus]